MIHIVYIIDDIRNAGGMERVLAVKANYLASKPEYHLSIISKRQHGTPFFHFNSGIELYFLALPPGRTGERVFPSRLEALLNKLRADIVISMYGSEMRFLYKLKDGSRKILEFHYSFSYLTELVKGMHKLRFRALHALKVRGKQFLDRYHVKKYDTFVVLSEQDRQAWQKVTDRAIAIPNPLSYSEFCAASLNVPRIIAAGRFTAQKGFDLLIEAFSRIASQHPEWTLDIFGEGQDCRYLQQCIEKFQLNRQVRLLQTSPQLRTEMLKSSIFAFPSRYEGFGLVLTEAMACGIPCVSFDCPSGPGEILTSGEDGILIPCYRLDEFAAALEKLMENKDLRIQMGAQALKNVKRFLPENVMPKWEALFHEITDIPR